MLDPLNATLWLYLHLFLPEDDPLKAKSIYKAYQLDSTDDLMKEHLIKHYLKSPKTFSKAFKLIIRAY